MRFGDFLRAAVLLSAGSATALAAITLIAATQELEALPVYVSVIWWSAASLIGLRLERRANDGIRTLLADARHQTTLPELRPGLTLVNRLWPLLVSTIVAGALGFLAPQIPGIATGFAVIWALAWRRQESAVVAIEERDGVTFYVERTSPVRPLQLVRTPGFRREVPSLDGAGS